MSADVFRRDGFDYRLVQEEGPVRLYARTRAGEMAASYAVTRDETAWLVFDDLERAGRVFNRFVSERLAARQRAFDFAEESREGAR